MEDIDVVARSPLRAIQDLNGLSTIWMPGSPSVFIIKSASSPPQVIPMSGGEVKSLHAFNTSGCRKGIAYLDSKVTVQLSSSYHPTGLLV